MLRVGIAQLDITLGNREANRRKVTQWMERHCAEKTAEPTVIVLPEIWDVGYALEDAETLADPEGSGPRSFWEIWPEDTGSGSPEGPFSPERRRER
jgi:predicted amidohydrolase